MVCLKMFVYNVVYGRLREIRTWLPNPFDEVGNHIYVYMQRVAAQEIKKKPPDAVGLQYHSEVVLGLS